jgi:MoaA/NifB/PqqE/SkfB family radical SAM enzyme
MAIEVTYRCNLKCEMCYERRQMEQLKVSPDKQQELSLEEIKHIIDQTPLWCLIIFTGGEPFCRRDILDILDYATRHRRCHIVTNGALITPKIAQTLVEMKLLSIGISIDGDEAIHDQLRGIPGTYRRAINAMKLIREYRQQKGIRWPLINLKTLISSSNVHLLTRMVEIGRQAGADYCTYQMMNNSLLISGMKLGDSLQPYTIRTPRFEDFDLNMLRKQLSGLEVHQHATQPKARYLPAIPTSELVAHYSNELNLLDYTCSSPWSGVNISAYGEAFPCFNYRVGNLREETLQEVWNGKRYRTFRLRLRKEGLFDGCVGCCDLTYRGHRN